jgi:hypothetical protein
MVPLPLQPACPTAAVPPAGNHANYGAPGARPPAEIVSRRPESCGGHRRGVISILQSTSG